MSDQRLINELREVKQELREMRDLLLKSELPVHEEEAARLMGVSLRHIQNCAYKGRLEGAYQLDMLGRRVYFMRALFGMKDAIIALQRKKRTPSPIALQTPK